MFDQKEEPGFELRIDIRVNKKGEAYSGFLSGLRIEESLTLPPQDLESMVKVVRRFHDLGKAIEAGR